MMEYTKENIEKIAIDIVESMELEDLIADKIEDLCDLMSHNKDMFNLNAKEYTNET